MFLDLGRDWLTAFGSVSCILTRLVIAVTRLLKVICLQRVYLVPGGLQFLLLYLRFVSWSFQCMEVERKIQIKVLVIASKASFVSETEA